MFNKSFFRTRTTPDRLAMLLSLVGVLVSFLVADRVFERVPHIEDEAAYLWQARVFASGQLTIPTPPHAKSYLVPFVVDYHGQRFGKYPPGWPALLAVAVKLGLRAWLNPLLAGLGIWLTYQLGKRFFNAAAGLLAAALTVTSPFFLMNSGTLLSHPLGLALSAAFALAWMELFLPPRGVNQGPAALLDRAEVRRSHRVAYFRVGVAGICLGLLVLTRPFSAVAVALPFAMHGLYLLARGLWSWLCAPTEAGAHRAAARQVLAIGLIALVCAGVYFGWQKAVTGEWQKNPYVLWWPYDEIGFGRGHGVLEEGHSLRQALFNTRRSLASGARDLFGWGALSWIFIPFGLWAVILGEEFSTARPARPGFPRNQPALLLVGLAASLIVLYMAYWIGSELYGPRYYYEGLPAAALLSAAGIAFLAGWRVNPGGEESAPALPGSHRAPVKRWAALARRLQAPAVMLALAGLVGYNLTVYLPGRLQEMHGLYGANRDIQRTFQAAKVFPDDEPDNPTGLPQLPALVIVHSEEWQFYGVLIELEDPFLTTPFIFAWSQHPTTDAVLHNDFPDRTVYHYYEAEPGVLYRRPRDKE